VFVNGGGNHDFMSNQLLGGVAPHTHQSTANLGEPRNADLSTFAGNQYFTSVDRVQGPPTIDGS